jgi:hypothetical protein
MRIWIEILGTGQTAEAFSYELPQVGNEVRFHDLEQFNARSGRVVNVVHVVYPEHGNLVMPVVVVAPIAPEALEASEPDSGHD